MERSMMTTRGVERGAEPGVFCAVAASAGLRTEPAAITGVPSARGGGAQGDCEAAGAAKETQEASAGSRCSEGLHCKQEEQGEEQGGPPRRPPPDSTASVLKEISSVQSTPAASPPAAPTCKAGRRSGAPGCSQTEGSTPTPTATLKRPLPSAAAHHTAAGAAPGTAATCRRWRPRHRRSSARWRAAWTPTWGSAPPCRPPWAPNPAQRGCPAAVVGREKRGRPVAKLGHG